MTARKAPAKKAPPRKRPVPLPKVDAQPGPTAPQGAELSDHDRLVILEQNYAQLRAEHDAVKSVIERAILAQIQQQLATNPDAQQALVSSLLAAQNGAPQS